MFPHLHREGKPFLRWASGENSLVAASRSVPRRFPGTKRRGMKTDRPARAAPVAAF